MWRSKWLKVTWQLASQHCLSKANNIISTKTYKLQTQKLTFTKTKACHSMLTEAAINSEFIPNAIRGPAFLLRLCYFLEDRLCRQRHIILTVICIKIIVFLYLSVPFMNCHTLCTFIQLWPEWESCSCQLYIHGNFTYHHFHLATLWATSIVT